MTRGGGHAFLSTALDQLGGLPLVAEAKSWGCPGTEHSVTWELAWGSDANFRPQ